MATSKRQQTTLSEIIPIFLAYAETHFSPNTCRSYNQVLTSFLDYHGDTPLNDIIPEDIEDYLHHMKYTPYNANRGAVSGENMRQRKPKTLANMHIVLSSLWSWATRREYALKDIMNAVPLIKVHLEPVDPLTDVELANLVRACARSLPYRSNGHSTNRRITAERDRALIGLLAETAIRSSEACRLRFQDVTFEPGRDGGGAILVKMGKGSKSRIVPFSRRCAGWLKEYMALRGKQSPQATLFVDTKGELAKAMTRSGVYQVCTSLGRRIQVHVNPHRLRTTAACMMLQNGMSIFDLQKIMGHSDIKTTKRYVAAARVDLAKAMRKASPLDNIRL